MRVLWITLAIVLVDQVTKTLVATTMIVRQSIPVLGDWLKWTFTENPGMAFGATLGDGDLAKVILTLFSVVATGLIFAYMRHVREAPLGYRASLALILGGALGNVIDRVFYGTIYGECLPGGGARLLHGCVVDFFHLDITRITIGDTIIPLFPIGNIADLAIIAGVVGVLLSQKSFQRFIQERHAPAEASTPDMDAETTPPVA
ncbi:MAG: signal peptidase II [Bacteroidota bacterium]